MSIYYKYTPDGKRTVLLSYVDEFCYWYTSKALVKWFVGAIENKFHVNFLVYAHWFMSKIFSHMKDHSISVYQARYDTSIVANHLILLQLRQI